MGEGASNPTQRHFVSQVLINDSRVLVCRRLVPFSRIQVLRVVEAQFETIADDLDDSSDPRKTVQPEAG